MSNRENGYAWRESNPNMFLAAIDPSENKPARKTKMTDEEFDNLLAGFRRKLNESPKHPLDRYWKDER